MQPLFELPFRQSRALLATGAPAFLLVNPVEFHGPHLSLRNDGLISLGLATALHAQLQKRNPEWPFLLAGQIEVGVDPCPGPGSQHTAFAVVRRLTLEACRALAELGAKRVVLVTFHGSPLHAQALDAGVRWLGRQGIAALDPLNLALQELVHDEPAVRDQFERAVGDLLPQAEREVVLSEVGRDFHAGFMETSLAMHYAPNTVGEVVAKLPPCPPLVPAPAPIAVSRAAKALGARQLSEELAFASLGLGWYQLRPFPGYTGRPHLADPRVGLRIADHLVERYADVATRVFDGQRPPRPVMRWLESATLGGRVGKVTVPLGAIAA